MDSVDPRILDDFTERSDEQHAEVPRCLLVSRARLQELSGELAKLKVLGHLNEASFVACLLCYESLKNVALACFFLVVDRHVFEMTEKN